MRGTARMDVTITKERADDVGAIGTLTTSAFAPKVFSDGNEATCIEIMRADGDLTLSLVARDGARIVGHVAFSPVVIEGTQGNWFGLGPVSVEPELQKQGIGSALILDGLDRLRGLNAAGCVLVGDPRYYTRFGFASDPALTYRDLDTSLVQYLAFGDEQPTGVLTFSRGLEI